MMPLISVCLPTYNGERFLAEQIQSVLDQTLIDFELVIGDDGSSDRTPDIVKDFAARDSRIRVLPPSSRLGMQRNYERVITAGVGQYIAPCDQDDVWLPEKLEAVLRLLQEKGVAMVYCDSIFVDQKAQSLDTTLLTTRYKIEGNDALKFAFHNCAAGHNMLFDRRILADALPFPNEPFYDWWLAAVAATTGGIAVLDRQLVLYRQHDTSVTADLRRSKTPNRSERIFGGNVHESKHLVAFSRLPGEVGAKYRRLAELWPLRTRRYFIPALTIFLLRHPSVFAARETTAWRTRWRSIMRGIGLPLAHPWLAREFHRKHDGWPPA